MAALTWRYMSGDHSHLQDARSSGGAPAPEPTVAAHHYVARARLTSRLAALVCLVGLFLTAAALLWERERLEAVDRARFDSLSANLEREIVRRVSLYRWALRETRSVFSASVSVERDEFRRLVAARDVSSEFPGTIGLGFVRRVRRGEVEDFLARTRADGAPSFTIKSSGDRPELMVIEYIEPLAQNRAAEGFDIASDSHRRDAAERSMLTGETALTSMVRLVQGENGFLYLLPVYRNDAQPTTPAERAAALDGWVYMPIVPARAFVNATASVDGELDFRVSEGDAGARGALIYASTTAGRGGNGRPVPFEATSRLELGGKLWTLTFWPTSAFRRSPANELWVIGVCGIALSLLLALLLRAQSSALATARTLADSMTADLRRLTSAAEEANRSKTEFLANMSHEIRTPMTAILGYSDLLAEAETGADSLGERLEYCDIIKRNGEHLLSIINDILDISRIEAGKMVLEKVATDPGDVCSNVIATMTVKAEAKGLWLKYLPASDLPARICTDPLRLRQVLINLVGNAIKFTEVGGVTLTVSFEARRVRFDVIDTGVGITEDQSGRLFQAFAQGDTSTTRKFEGTGLGLQISKRLVELLGGSIGFDSRPGRGTTFTFSIDAGELPAGTSLVPAASGNRRVAGSSARGKLLNGVRILLAEDRAENQRLIAFHLRRAGALVRIVEDGKQAVEALTADGTIEGPLLGTPGIDLVVTDMQMPEMDGYRATRLLRSKGCTLPIIALTAHSLSGDAEKCLAAGCSAYLSKPIDRSKLVEVCREALASRPRTSTRPGPAELSAASRS